VGGFFGCTEALENGFRIKPGMTVGLGLEEDSGFLEALSLAYPASRKGLGLQ
jgi:hypothetical protein